MRSDAGSLPRAPPSSLAPRVAFSTSVSYHATRTDLPLIPHGRYVSVNRANVGVLVWCILCAVSPAVAGTYGILEGNVRERSTGESLPGVNISVASLQRGTTTDVRGRFQLQQIPSGTYEVRFSLVGYTVLLLRNVEIHPDLRTRLTVDLDPADVTLDEIIVVRETPPIERDITGTTYLVRGDDILLLPLDNITEALALKPGVTMEGHVRGGRTSEVLYLVDGLPVQDVLSGTASGLATWR